METTTHTCDILDCTNQAQHFKQPFTVIFHTNQIDGGYVKPYFHFVRLDMCKDCMQRNLAEGRYIRAKGAMGHNRYSL